MRRWQIWILLVAVFMLVALALFLVSPPVNAAPIMPLQRATFTPIPPPTPDLETTPAPEATPPAYPAPAYPAPAHRQHAPETLREAWEDFIGSR